MPGSGEAGGGRKVTPTLPTQHSPAERVATNRNRVLQRRLQYHMDTINRARRAWLTQIHIQAARYRRRADHLHHMMQDIHASTEDDGLPCHDDTSGPDVISPRCRKPRARRPTTSLPFRTSDPRTRRPKTAGCPRPKTTGTLNNLGKPFKVRDNQLKSASSDDDYSDSDDSSLTVDSDESDEYSGNAVKFNSPFGRKLTNPQTLTDPKTAGTNRNFSETPLKNNARRIQSAFVHTPIQSLGTASTTRRAQKGSHAQRVVWSQGRSSAPRNQEESGKQVHNNLMNRRAQTAVGTSWNRRKTTSATDGVGVGGRKNYGGSGGGGGDGGGRRDSNYIRYVLSLEREQYELNQMKLRNYLQNLTI